MKPRQPRCSRLNTVAAHTSITNIYPVFSPEHKWARLLVVAVGVLHAGVALAMKILFYSYAVAGKVDNVDVGGDAAEPVERMIRALLQ